MAFIYVITNDVNCKQYVGKTNSSIEKRFQEHIRNSRQKRYEKRPLYSAMNKYGIEHFHIGILEECSANESADREIYWIDKLCTYGHTGYNATRGGDSKKYYCYQEIADKYQELQNQTETANWFNCNVHTVRIACRECNVPILSNADATIQKMGNQVAMLDKNTEEIIVSFLSERAAERFLQKQPSGKIGQVCKGKRKTAYGYKWKYI